MTFRPTPSHPSPESKGSASKQIKIYTVGTLRYNQQQLIVLFFWLMWNDFSIMLIEQVGSLSDVLMKAHGATFMQMALLGSIGGFFTPWINPWVSTWSDRHRGRFGRRRPFLFIATPFFALFLMVTPYMPNLYHYLLRFPFVAAALSHIPMSGPAFFVGICGLISGAFNAVVLAIFSYLYWDVVPESHMGRFQSLSKTVTLIAGLVWSFCIYGLADHHMKTVFVGTAVFCLVIYLVSVWQIKEGKYPPPDPHRTGGVLAPIRAYFVECFSQPYFLWIFVAYFIYQLGNQGNRYQFFYVYKDLHLDLAIIGWVKGWASLIATGFGVALGFVIGSITDRLKSVRLMAPSYAALSLIQLGSFFVVHDRWTYLISITLCTVFLFINGIIFGAYNVDIFPREKIGQFCSAQAVFQQVIINILSPFIGNLFDHLHDNRLGYLWTATFYGLAAIAYIKVYLNWKERHGRTPVPRAG